MATVDIDAPALGPEVLFERAPQPMLVLEPATHRVLRVNGACERLFEAPAAKLEDRPLATLLDGAPHAGSAVVPLPAGDELGAARRVRLRFGPRVGATGDLLTVDAPRARRVVGWLLLHTERHQLLEAQIRDLAELPEANPFPVLRCAEDGTILYRNPSAQVFTARIGQPQASIDQLLPSDFTTRLGRVLDQDVTVVDETHRALGRTLSLTYEPLAQARQVFVIIVDVTTRVEAVQQCRSYATELEQINRELKAAQAQLVQAEKMASLGNLVAGLVHEMNTPLASIRSGAEVMIRAVERLESGGAAQLAGAGPRVRAALRQVGETTLAATERLVAVLTSLRNFSRLDEARVKPVDLHQGLESTLTLLRHRLGRHVEVVRRYGALPEVVCVPNQINQVFMNVLVNAIQAIDAAGTITLSSRREGAEVVIEISDTGDGIAAEDLPRVFDPGFTTRGVKVGTGLGLATAYRIIEQHHGAINLRSEPGAGTSVQIHLPIRHVAAQAADVPQPSEGP